MPQLNPSEHVKGNIKRGLESQVLLLSYVCESRSDVNDGVVMKPGGAGIHRLIPQKADGPTMYGILISRTISPKTDTNQPLHSCKPIAHLQLLPTSLYWTLQALDDEGNDKTVGGDEFYIFYTNVNS